MAAMAAGPRTEPLALELKSPGIVRGFSFGAAKNRDQSVQSYSTLLSSDKSASSGPVSVEEE